MQPDLGPCQVQKTQEPLRVWVIAGGYAAPAFEPADAPFNGVARRVRYRSGSGLGVRAPLPGGNDGLGAPLRPPRAEGVAVIGPVGHQAGQRRVRPGFHQGLSLGAVVVLAACHAQAQGPAAAIRQDIATGAARQRRFPRPLQPLRRQPLPGIRARNDRRRAAGGLGGVVGHGRGSGDPPPRRRPRRAGPPQAPGAVPKPRRSPWPRLRRTDPVRDAGQGHARRARVASLAGKQRRPPGPLPDSQRRLARHGRGVDAAFAVGRRSGRYGQRERRLRRLPTGCSPT